MADHAMADHAMKTTAHTLPTRTVSLLESCPAAVRVEERLAAYHRNPLSLPLVSTPNVYRRHSVVSARASLVQSPSALLDAVRATLPPLATPEAVHALVGRLSPRRVLRVDLEVPDYHLERQRPERITRTPVPRGSLVLGICQIMGLLAISRREAEHAFRHNLVTVIESAWRVNQHGPYRFAVVDNAMRDWLRRHERWVPLSEIGTGSTARALGRTALVSPESVAGHAATFVRHVATGCEVSTGFYWLRWCARQRSEAERQEILAKQVVG